MKAPAVVVLARSVAAGRLPVGWNEPIAAGHMAVVSANAHAARLTAQLALQRNEVVAALAASIAVAHAQTGGSLATQIVGWQSQGMSIQKLT